MTNTYLLITTDPAVPDINKEIQITIPQSPQVLIMTINQMNIAISILENEIAQKQQEISELQNNINAAVVQFNLKP